MALEYRKCDRCERNRQLKFFAAKGRVCFPCQKKTRTETAHAYRVSRTYGMDAGDYDRLFEAQGGKCAICGGERPYKLDVDHDHKTGFVRGLVCKRENREILRAAQDDAALLRAAADYLDSPPAFKVIGYKKVDTEDT